MHFGISLLSIMVMFVFFFNDPATPEIYTLSLHDALPISEVEVDPAGPGDRAADAVGVHLLAGEGADPGGADRKSTRLNSSHPSISYAVFCLKKKKNNSLP